MDVCLLFTYSSADRQLGCFNFLATVNNIVMNDHAQVFVKNYVFNSLGYIPRSGTEGSSLFLCV